MRTGFTYDLAGNLKSVSDPKANVTQYGYDAAHRLVKVTDATGHAYTPYEYDKVSNRIAVSDANGNRMTYLFDGLNRPARKTDPEGHVETYSYDRVGNRRTVADGRTYITETQYDPLNRPVKVIDPLLGVDVLTYDAVGTLKTRTDPAGHTETFTHDKVYRLLTRADGAGNTWQYKYDDAGNPTLAVDPNGNPTAYDVRCTQATDQVETNALNGVTKPRLRAVGNEIARTAANGVATRFQYDPLYRLVALTRNFKPGVAPAADVNVVFRSRYDAASNLIEELDALTITRRSHDYDKLNRRIGPSTPRTARPTTSTTMWAT